MSSDIGIYGLTSQGIALALNIASKGYLVTVGNKSSDKIKECIELAENGDLEEKIRGIKDAEDFVKNLKTPRKILLLSRPGSSVDRNMQKLLPFMESGDILIDGSCDNVEECARRSLEAQEKSVEYMTLGILGNDSDARNGPSFLPSGPKAVYDTIEPLLNKVACEIDHHACVGYVGSGMIAVLAKQAIDALETSGWQLVAEAIDMMRQARMNNQEMSRLFSQWATTDETSLFETVSVVLEKKDTDVEGCKPTDNNLIDRISDVPPSLKVPSDWNALSPSVEESVSIPASAMDARFVAHNKDTRVKLSREYTAPKFDWSKMDLQEVTRDLHDAILCARDILYAQIFAGLFSAAQTREWELNLSELTAILRGVPSIRSARLDQISAIFEKSPSLANLLLDKSFGEQVMKKQKAFRRILSLGTTVGVSLPTSLAAVTYFDSCRCGRLPGALVQCLRDALNGDGFERLDKERGEVFHCKWTK